MTLATYKYGLIYDFSLNMPPYITRNHFYLLLEVFIFSSVSNPRTINRKC